MDSGWSIWQKFRHISLWKLTLIVRDQLWQARWCHCDNSTQHAWDCYSTGSMVSQESLGLLALQLWTLLRFILLEYIITAAGPLKHTSTSASVVWAPLHDISQQQVCIILSAKDKPKPPFSSAQETHQCMCYHTSLCVSSLFSYLHQDNKKVMNQWCMSLCSNYCCTTFPCSSRLNP
jgi:hypothetical protein